MSCCYRLLRGGLLVVLICLPGVFVSAAESDPSRSAVDAAVQRAIPYLQREGESWIEKRGCVSCHQVPFMLWSLSAAQRAGFDVATDDLQARRDWATDVASFVAPKQRDGLDQPATLAGNIDTINALLLAMQPDQTTDVQWRKTFTDALLANQQPDGSWKACGQLPMQKRPPMETQQVTVLWTLLALASEDVEPAQSDVALAFAENDQPQSTEWWVARLLLADRRNEPGTADLRQSLIELQKPDGGWGWLSEDPSDAMATGMALYALQRTQPDPGAAADTIQAAVDFLIADQNKDGSWSVPGTKKTSRDKATATSTYWGTAWAVIGLLE